MFVKMLKPYLFGGKREHGSIGVIIPSGIKVAQRIPLSCSRFILIDPEGVVTLDELSELNTYLDMRFFERQKATDQEASLRGAL